VDAETIAMASARAAAMPSACGRLDSLPGTMPEV
jgi:hypothetical protein